MAELNVGSLNMTIEVDGRAAIFEINKVAEAVESSTTDAARAYRQAGEDMADAFEPAAEAAEETGEAVRKTGEEARKAGREFEDSGQVITSSLKKNIETAEKFGTTLSATVTAPLLALYGVMVKGSADLAETISKTDVTFGALADDVMDWSETAIDSMGLAQSTALDMAATYGDMGTAMQIDLELATEMSTTLTQLAADMASFKNISADRAAQALTGVYTGETEALKSLGVVMTQTNLQAFALSQGITRQVSSMSQVEQVQLRYAYVMQQTANAQGDFARTNQSLSNNSRVLVQTLKQAGNAFGDILNPAVNAGVTLLREGAESLAKLDEDTKTMILSVGGVVAATGPLILAGTKVLKLVTAIRAAATAASFGPIGLAIAGVTLAAGLAYTALDSMNNQIDTSSEKYQRLKGALSGGATVAIDADTAELDALNGSTVTVNIDANAELALQKAQGLLNDLQSDKYTGVMTIDGDPQKAQAALDALETAVQNMLGGTGSLAELQAAVDACEELVISPEVDEETRSIAQGKLEELKTLVNGISSVNVTWSVNQAEDSDEEAWEEFRQKVSDLGWETKEYTATGKFVVEAGTLEDAEAYKQALIEAATATDDYEAAVNNLNNLLDQDMAAKIADINAQAAEQVDYQARLRNSGIIDEETYNANIQAIVDGVQRETEALESQYEITKRLNEQFDNGVRADDASVLGQQALTVSGGAQLTEEDYQSAVATLQAARDAGEDMAQYQTEAMIVNQMLRDQTIENYDAMIAAQQEYESAIDAANAKKEKTITDNEALLENAETMQKAITAYANSVKFGNEDAETYIDKVAKTFTQSAEEYETIKNQMTQALSDPATGELQTSGLQELIDYYGAMQEEAKAALEGADAALEAEQTAAVQRFADSLEGISGEFTAAEQTMMMELITATRATLSSTDAELIAGTQSMLEELIAMLEGGETDVADQAAGIIDAVGDETANARGQGEDVGAAIAAGIEAGLESGSGPLYATMRRIVDQAIQEARIAADINSPSRKSKKQVGLPIIQGVGSGVEEGTPNVVRTMKESVQKVVAGAATVVNHGVYTTPAIQSAVQNQFDYDKMGDALAGAVRELRLAVDINGKRAAEIMREDNARQLALREHEQNMARGRT